MTKIEENLINIDDNVIVISAKGTITVKFQSGDKSPVYALVNLNDCPYSSECRQVMVDESSKIQIVNVQDPNNVIVFNVSICLLFVVVIRICMIVNKISY